MIITINPEHNDIILKTYKETGEHPQQAWDRFVEYLSINSTFPQKGKSDHVWNDTKATQANIPGYYYWRALANNHIGKSIARIKEDLHNEAIQLKNARRISEAKQTASTIPVVAPTPEIYVGKISSGETVYFSKNIPGTTPHKIYEDYNDYYAQNIDFVSDLN